MSHFCTVIIVTHNSEKYLGQCLKCLKSQSVAPDQIIIVDSGSQDTKYLKKYAESDQSIFLSLNKNNVGFCEGNNIGYGLLAPKTEFVLFLNPDAFLVENFIENALNLMKNPSMVGVGALSGLLIGYDIDREVATDLTDSSGIFSTWYGKWFDRDQGKPLADCHYAGVEYVPALCGALMFCRKQALESILIRKREVMDASFYMYKEDIDLSLRLGKQGWKLLFDPKLKAYHCRGWQSDRKKVARCWRLMSAKNEMRLYKRLRSPCYFYSAFKFLCVKCFNL